MSRLRFLYRLLGTMWVVVGLSILLVAIGYLLASITMDLFFNQLSPELAQVIGPLLWQQSNLQQWAALAFGLFCVFFGVGLLGLRSWARTVGVVFNIAMGACLAMLVLMLYTRLTDPNLLPALPGQPPIQVPEELPRWLAVIGGLLSLGLLAAGFHLSTASAMEAFFGVPPAVPPLPPVKCPTCGGPLDLSKAQCPSCDAPDDDSGPAKARLIDVQTNRAYPVSLLHLTHIGRDNSACEIQLDDPSVSHEHALIEYASPRFHLHALKDINGTYVNDARVRYAEIRNEDRIRFGKAQFRFVVEKRE